MRHVGSASPTGFHAGDAMIGSPAALIASSATWTIVCVRGFVRVSACAYAYPASSTAWKNTTHTVHTDAVPPNHGRICFATIGWTRNSRNAEPTIVMPYRIIAAKP